MSECERSATSVDERHVKLLLELRECLRQRGLAEAKGARGGCEPAVFDDGEEEAEVMEVERHNQFS
jgi:hypothetical protein